MNLRGETRETDSGNTRRFDSQRKKAMPENVEKTCLDD